MLKNKEDIENYDEKAKFLKDNGWTDLWHEDNWVQEDWFDDSSINVDRAGIPTDVAFNNCIKTREKFGLDVSEIKNKIKKTKNEKVSIISRGGINIVINKLFGKLFKW